MKRENNPLLREIKRHYRHQRIRKVSFGKVDCPRFCVHRSLNNLSAQIVDDSNKKILFGASTQSKEFRQTVKSGGNVAAAKALGGLVGAKAKQKGITRVCFDRGGYAYHGRVKAFADAVRESGIQF